MAKTAPIKRARRQPREFDGFYETMPLTALPHAVYRDDDEVSGAWPADEAGANDRRLTLIVSLAVMVLMLVGLIVLVGYGLASLARTTG